jgi:hypothetical protein
MPDTFNTPKNQNQVNFLTQASQHGSIHTFLVFRHECDPPSPKTEWGWRTVCPAFVERTLRSALPEPEQPSFVFDNEGERREFLRNQSRL